MFNSLILTNGPGLAMSAHDKWAWLYNLPSLGLPGFQVGKVGDSGEREKETETEREHHLSLL